jgi:hypothetical protein
MAAIAKWADYIGYPGGAALAGAGFAGVARYVGLGSTSKRITAAEYQDLVAHGIQVLLVCELNTHDAEGGYAAGVSNATAALADARAKGIPDSVGIAAACDEHLTSAQIAAAVDYVRGFRDVLGQARTGAYGFAEFVDAVHAAGYVSWLWKCGAAPTTAESSWITFWQRNAGTTTQTVNRVVVDIDDQETAIPNGAAAVTQPDFTQTDRNALDGEANQIVSPFFPASAKHPDGVPQAQIAAVPVDGGPLMVQVLYLVQALGTVNTQLTAVQGALSTDEAALLAAIKGVATGAVDVSALAAALTPVLAPVDAAELVKQLGALFPKAA